MFVYLYVTANKHLCSYK